MFRSLLITCLVGLCLSSCGLKTATKSGIPNFTLQKLRHVNQITEDTLNVYSYHYLYNGGGVGIADFNNDGYKDIFLGGNMVSASLLLGTPSLTFEDVTEQAGIQTSEWINGVSVVDINHDGWKDIYLSVGGPDCSKETCENILFLNCSSAELLKFERHAKNYGLNIAGYSQQGLFLDVDLDGDLDLYQLQNHIDPTSKNYPKPKYLFSKESLDKLLINQEAETGTITFIDQSKKWGVTQPGFGLGITLTDVNLDGYPDIYIANDFISDDIFYVNKDGKYFEDQSHQLLKHTSFNSMGVDIADVNEDGLEDIIVVDMLPPDNSRQKTMLGSMNYYKYLLSLKESYNAQFIRNTFQVHNGVSHERQVIAPFSEIGAMLNIHETDWSWAPLLADFDNDTDIDLFITNGYGKDVTDLDFINYNIQSTGFASQETVAHNIKAQIDQLPDVKLPNYFFEQTEGGSFKKHISTYPSISNGAAYGDLDNDGDLDLVINNLNSNSVILSNQTNNNFLKILLKGEKYNVEAIGARVEVTLTNGETLLKTLCPVRSYLSSIDLELVFGLGHQKVSNIQVTWPNQAVSTIDTLIHNSTLQICQKSEDTLRLQRKTLLQNSLLTGKKVLLNEKKTPIPNHSFSVQPLLMKAPHEKRIIIRKLNGKSQFLIANYQLELGILSKKKGTYSYSSILPLEGRKVTDLIVDESHRRIILTSISENTPLQSREARIHILKMQSGTWMEDTSWLIPRGIYKLALAEFAPYPGKEIVLGRFPAIGDYPLPEGKSLIIYKRVGNNYQEVNLDLPHTIPACIKDIMPVNIRGKAFQEIIIVGEWMEPMIIYQQGQSLHLEPLMPGSNMFGMWQCISGADFDKDGDIDFILGNLGLNTRYKANPENNLMIVAEDLDKNGSIDPILSHYQAENDTYYTYQSRDDLVNQLPSIKDIYQSYQSFSKADFMGIVSSLNRDPNLLKASTFSSVILENVGEDGFKIIPLPKESQFSVVNSCFLEDADGDGDPDIFLLTNCEEVETHNGKIDGLNGLLIENTGSMKFNTLPATLSGFIFPTASYQMVKADEWDYLIATQHSIYSISKSQHLDEAL